MRDPQTGVRTFARVKVPKEMLPRFLSVGEDGLTFVALEQVIAAHLAGALPGMEVVDSGVFRVTRDADFEVSDEADDLLEAVEAELRRRRFGEVVRLEINADMSDELREALTQGLRVEERQVYKVEGLLDFTDLWQIVKLPGFGELRDPPWTPVTQPRLQGDDTDGVDMFEVIRQGDVLVHHPYDSWSTSVERFVGQAVEDPDVLAIKMTVYRTSDDTPLVPALIRATERGKQAVCMVELKARGDERANIGWARALEEAGVHVVYGHPASRRTRSACSSSAARATASATTSTSARATTTRRRPASTPTSACSPAARSSAPTSATCSTSSPASPGRGAIARCSWRRLPARRDAHRDRGHDRRAQRRQAGAHPR